MKIQTLLFLILFGSKCYGQIDTNLIYQKADYIIRLIENKNIDSLLINSTDSIRCLPCKEVGNKKYISATSFFTQRLQENFSPKLISKLKNAKKMIIKQSEPYPAYVVFYKIINKGEIAPTHEGVDFGIWLNIDKNLKFTAIETIP